MRERSGVAVVLLAGGRGTRLGGPVPKQYQELAGRPIARYSFDVYVQMPEVDEIVVVCDPAFQSVFAGAAKPVRFAEPGERRQDSLYNGVQAVSPQCGVIVSHDAARPFVTPEVVRRVIEAAWHHGAATAAVPLRFTVKRCEGDCWVANTLERDALWEVQTPQAIRTALLKEAFEHATACHLEVTDDVGLVEAIRRPVKVVRGDDANLKITTPVDLTIAKAQVCSSTE